MFRTLAEFQQEAKPLIDVFEKFIEEHQLATEVRADHLCYKCETQEEFDEKRKLFEFESHFVYQSIISKRRIAIVKFKEGFVTRAGSIDYLEISDQKPDGSQKSKFDHVEVYPLKGTVQAVVENLKGEGVEVREVVRPHHTTYDIVLEQGFMVRIEQEALVDKIKQEEMM